MMITIMLSGIATSVVTFSASNIARADTYDTQIQKLRDEISNYNTKLEELATQADTLNTAIASLQGQQDELQAEINLNNAEIKKLNEQIADNEKKLDDQGRLLNKTLVGMYVGGKTTPLEMLAGSQSLSDYIDAQSQAASVKSQVSESIQSITKLKNQLSEQKSDLQTKQENLASQKSALAASQSQQQGLLDQTNGDEQKYQDMVKDNEANIAKMLAQQARLRSSYNGSHLVSVTDNGDYLAASDCVGSYMVNRNDTPNWYNWYSNKRDNLGYGCRQCVSFAAWKMGQVTGLSPKGWGNAGMWPDAARNNGYTVSQTPRGNSLGVISGDPGHIVYVNSVDADGTLTIEQYNAALKEVGNMYGQYTHLSGVRPSTYQEYIYL
jgi:peptidoglycan hydrolase CwlO-like protein